MYKQDRNLKTSDIHCYICEGTLMYNRNKNVQGVCQELSNGQKDER